MKTKQFEKDQLQELVQLFNISMPRDKFTSELVNENVIDDMYENPELCLAAFEDEILVGFGMGVIRKRETEKVGYLKFLAVHPEFRRKGIARNLYNQIESIFVKNNITKIRLIESWPNYYMPGIDPFYTEAVAFFERFGFVKDGDAANLKCDLELQSFDTKEDEEKVRENGIEIRRAVKADYDDIMNWSDKNFAAWRFEIANSFLNDPISLHLSKLNGEIIAFSAHSSNNPGLPWFGPVGTTEAARGKGVGGILLKRCLQDLKELKYKIAIIPWVANIPFYMHYINSKVDRVFWRYEKKLR